MWYAVYDSYHVSFVEAFPSYLEAKSFIKTGEDYGHLSGMGLVHLPDRKAEPYGSTADMEHTTSEQLLVEFDKRRERLA